MAEKIELLLEDFLGGIQEQKEEVQDKISMWIKDKDYYIPSTDISTTKTLPPGMYQVNYTNDRGYHCRPIKTETDEIFVFTDSITKELLDEIELFWNKKFI